METTIANDLRAFSSDIVRDTREVWKRRNKEAEAIPTVSIADFGSFDESIRNELLAAVRDNTIFLSDPQVERALVEYPDFEPNQNDIAMFASIPYIHLRLSILVPDYVPNHTLFWKRLLYNTHLICMKSIAEPVIVGKQVPSPPTTLDDEESVKWDD